MSKKKERDNGLPECLVTSHRLGDHMKILRVGLELTNERMQVLEEICKIRGGGDVDFREYVEKAVQDQMDNDLETPNDLGLDYCKHLKHILSRNSVHGD